MREWLSDYKTLQVYAKDGSSEVWIRDELDIPTNFRDELACHWSGLNRGWTACYKYIHGEDSLHAVLKVQFR